MDKNAIKKFAVWARRELIERVSQKALQYGITAEETVDAGADSINGNILTADEKKQRQALIHEISAKGYEEVMEEVAYTWFNRFSALRFMEVNGYLPTHVRVFTDEENNFKPQIIDEAIHMELDGLDMEKVFACKDANQTEELYKYLLIVQCNALNGILPGMFQRIADYTELLLPDNLLREGSVIQQMIELLPEDNFDINSDNGQIEVIGWLYQYYISEKHEQVVDPIYGKEVPKEDVPAATQLFTTDWVVRYILDNSLGRYWVENHSDSTLKSNLNYLISQNIKSDCSVGSAVNPENIKVIDPCVGSGHFLIYAFDILLHIYEECGYSDRDAVSLIVEKNLYGLDVDERAAQLAYFSIMMKARQYDRRFFTRDVQPQVYCIRESNNIDKYAIEYFCNGDGDVSKALHSILDDMADAKEYGSLLRVKPFNRDVLDRRIESIEGDINISKETAINEIVPIIKVAEILADKYTVVATNPPYLNKYSPKLKEFITTEYKNYSGDMFSAFMYRNFLFCEDNGYSGLMTPNVWMFIRMYEKLREFIIQNKSITTLVQMAKGAFFKEATVDICAFVMKNCKETCPGCYIRLDGFKGDMDVQRRAVESALKTENCGYFFETKTDKFYKIPNTPIAYYVEPNFFNIYDRSELLGEYGSAREGMATGCNDLFMRSWYEVSKEKTALSCKSCEDAVASCAKWFPYNKGGDFRKWYGNDYFLVNWENDGYAIKNFKDEKTGRIRSHNYNQDFIFREGATWTALSSGNFACRYSSEGHLADSKGSMFYAFDEAKLPYLLGILNSCISTYILGVTSQTLDFKPGRVSELPIVFGNLHHVSSLVENLIDISKSDWDSFETSWNFSQNPLVRKALSRGHWGDDGAIELEYVYRFVKQDYEQRFHQLKANEEELNRIFIDIYGLQDELTPEVEDRDVTVYRYFDEKEDIPESMGSSKYALTKRDMMVSFISYAVGCMLGRYSLDVEGLAFAGGEWDAGKYRTFPADGDNIIPICDDEYFDDDIVGRFIKFVEVAFGAETLQENLKFIADALGGKGQPKEVIRNYFLNDFFKDHCKTYQKRPIYWLFDSGKKDGFKALIYMHRYQPDTIARIRTDYVHEQQSRYRTAIADLEARIASASTGERVKLNKALAELQDQAAETRAYEEKIHHLADQMIPIDLDDGVKHNYEIFKDVLAKIK